MSCFKKQGIPHLELQYFYTHYEHTTFILNMYNNALTVLASARTSHIRPLQWRKIHCTSTLYTYTCTLYIYLNIHVLMHHNTGWQSHTVDNDAGLDGTPTSIHTVHVHLYYTPLSLFKQNPWNFIEGKIVLLHICIHFTCK